MTSTVANKMGITSVTYPKGRLRFRIKKAHMEAIAGEIYRLMVERIGQGEGADGRQFQKYAADYAETRRAMGRQIGRVDFHVSGGLLAALQERSTQIANEMTASVVFGFAPTTSERVRPPPKGPKVQPRSQKHAAQMEARREKKARAVSTGDRGPEHNRIAYWHQTGAGNNPVRRILGLTPEEEKHMAAFIRTLDIVTLGPA